MVIEICANSAASCVAAAKGGANRVELCAGIPEGGTTPSVGEVRAAIEATRGTGLQVFAIIRPRSGDFLYSELEIEAMKYDIEALLRCGVDGLVFGCLTASGEVDMELNGLLVRHARAIREGVQITFHRAIDMCRDPLQALEDIITLGFNRVLTSGGQATAAEGVELIAQMQRRASGRITIMAGSGVNSTNIKELATKSGCTEFHFSARGAVESKMEYRHEGVSMGGTVTIDEYSNMVTSADIVANTRKELDSTPQA